MRHFGVYAATDTRDTGGLNRPAVSAAQHTTMKTSQSHQAASDTSLEMASAEWAYLHKSIQTPA